MIKKYYRILLKESTTGLLYPIGKHDDIICADGKPVSNIDKLRFRLKDGEYGDYNSTVGSYIVVSSALKSVIEEYIPSGILEFHPVKAFSNEYGNRTLYLLHFNIIYDVIDEERSKYDFNRDGTKSLLVVPRFNIHKVNGLDIFNYAVCKYFTGISISERFKRRMESEGLAKGIEFSPVYAVDENEPITIYKIPEKSNPLNLERRTVLTIKRIKKVNKELENLFIDWIEKIDFNKWVPQNTIALNFILKETADHNFFTVSIGAYDKYDIWFDDWIEDSLISEYNNILHLDPDKYKIRKGMIFFDQMSEILYRYMKSKKTDSFLNSKIVTIDYGMIIRVPHWDEGE